MIQLMESRSKTRPTSARIRPMRRASGCCSSGSLFERIEMKTMLSIPRTISRRVSVPSAIQASGVLIHSKDIDGRVGQGGGKDAKDEYGQAPIHAKAAFERGMQKGLPRMSQEPLSSCCAQLRGVG